jgi:hypothetical protein
MSSRIGTIEKYWNAIPNVHARVANGTILRAGAVRGPLPRGFR